jgi:hypothetical protein
MKIETLAIADEALTAPLSRQRHWHAPGSAR